MAHDGERARHPQWWMPGTRRTCQLLRRASWWDSRYAVEHRDTEQQDVMGHSAGPYRAVVEDDRDPLRQGRLKVVVHAVGEGPVCASACLPPMPLGMLAMPAATSGDRPRTSPALCTRSRVRRGPGGA